MKVKNEFGICPWCRGTGTYTVVVEGEEGGASLEECAPSEDIGEPTEAEWNEWVDYLDYLQQSAGRAIEALAQGSIGRAKAILQEVEPRRH